MREYATDNRADDIRRRLILAVLETLAESPGHQAPESIIMLGCGLSLPSYLGMRRAMEERGWITVSHNVMRATHAGLEIGRGER